VKKKMVLERELFKNIPLRVSGLNYGEGVYELEDCVGEEALSSNLPPNLGLMKKKILVGFSNHLLENA
jgi:hypothetical protein